MYLHPLHAPKIASQSEFLKSPDGIRLPNPRKTRHQRLNYLLCDQLRRICNTPYP